MCSTGAGLSGLEPVLKSPRTRSTTPECGKEACRMKRRNCHSLPPFWSKMQRRTFDSQLAQGILPIMEHQEDLMECHDVSPFPTKYGTLAVHIVVSKKSLNDNSHAVAHSSFNT
ncbi:unnamed protein product [Caretta caretta]